MKKFSCEENFADFPVLSKICQIKFPQNLVKSTIRKIKLTRKFKHFETHENWNHDCEICPLKNKNFNCAYGKIQGYS